MSIAAPATLLLIALSGCSLFHHGEPPQQRFLDALDRGNNAEASQIWLHMDADDRLSLARGTGLKPSASVEDLRNQLQRATESATDHASLSPVDPNPDTIALPNLDSPPLEPSRAEP